MNDNVQSVFSRWFRKYFSDPEAIILALLLFIGFTIVIYLGEMLAPLLASVVIAYLLEGIVRALVNRKVPRIVAVSIVFSVFMACLLIILFVLIPLLSGQVSQLVQELPKMLASGQKMLSQLPELYPHFVTEAQVQEIMEAAGSAVTTLGQSVVSFSIASIPSLLTIGIYLVLLPVLVFFLMKDKTPIIVWMSSMLPRERALAARIWEEMDQQIGNYVRGKFTEILIVGVVSYIVFALMGLNFAPLLGVLVGLSVIIPFIGAIVVTLPVVLIAFFQWGFTSDFAWVVVAYLIIQALDGNVLVPLLFSEAVNLHPVAIIIAVLVFGGFWGFWGVFFAIPLATLVKAILNSWPRAAID